MRNYKIYLGRVEKILLKNNQLTIVSWATFPPLLFVSMIRSDKKYKRNPKLLWWQIHIGPFGTNPLENLPWAPNGQGKLWKTKKSDRESQSKQPTAFSVLMRFRSTNRNRFSSPNGREISSSVFGQTRLGQLYPLFFFDDFPNHYNCTTHDNIFLFYHLCSAWRITTSN